MTAAAAKTFKVTGAGSFTHTITTEATEVDCNVICNSHASSNIYIECLDITLTADAEIECRAINAILGTVVLKCRSLTATGGESTAVWWENGQCDVSGASCYGGKYGVYTKVDDEPTGDLHVYFSEIEGVNSGVYVDGDNGNAALWIRANTVAGGAYSVYNVINNLNKTYVECQKLIGTVESSGGLLYVRADKIAIGNAGLYLFVTGASGSSYIQIAQWDTADSNDYFASISGGTHYFLGGVVVANSASSGFAIASGTATLQGLIINTAASASANPIVKSGGTLTLDGCTLVAEGTRNAIEAGTAQNVAVAGVLMANRPLDADVTLAGGIFIRSDTGAVTFYGSLQSPTFVTPVLGTPASGDLGNCTGYDLGDLDGAGTGVLTFLATPSSANLLAAITDETGTGALVFGTSPGFTTAANPVSNDGAALGTTALGWSDAHFATGAVINFANGNLTMTHSAAAMSVTGTWTFVTSPTSPGSGANTERFGASASTSTATNATAIGNGASVSGDYGTAVGRGVVCEYRSGGHRRIRNRFGHAELLPGVQLDRLSSGFLRLRFEWRREFRHKFLHVPRNVSRADDLSQQLRRYRRRRDRHHRHGLGLGDAREPQRASDLFGVRHGGARRDANRGVGFRADDRILR
jgi:hypothetical protein